MKYLVRGLIVLFLLLFLTSCVKEILVPELYCPLPPVTELVCHEPSFSGDKGQDVVLFVEALRFELRTCVKRMDTVREISTALNTLEDRPH